MLSLIADMEVVSVEVAQEMQAKGHFLLEQTVLGHVYGVTSAAVRKLQALGKLPLLDLDRVADVAKLKSSGFQVGSCSYNNHLQKTCKPHASREGVETANECHHAVSAH
jgi:hypothetical protein